MKEQDILAVREFNRFYTNVIGAVNEHLAHTGLSLPEARLLFELNRMQTCTASDILAILRMDKGYLSRILNGFIRKGWVAKKKNKNDARSTMLQLTSKGQAAYAKLHRITMDQIGSLISPLPDARRSQLIKHMEGIRKILDTNP